MSEVARIQEAAEFLRGSGWNDSRVALVLGSGLKRYGETLDHSVEIEFASIPHWPVPKVEGHGGSLVLGDVAGVPVACLTGRVHLYEGWEPADAVRAVRTLRLLGVPVFVLTNAAGGICTEFGVGDLMALRDHLNLTGKTPLLGEHVAEFGPRFPDQSAVYSPDLRATLIELDDRLRVGVYAGMLGPSYETPAEVGMLRNLGADAVGMSTVHEAIALNAMGADVAAISLISNAAAGISGQPLAHAEVIEAGRLAERRLTELVTGFCSRMADA